MSKHQLQRSPIRFKGRADPSHIYLNSDSERAEVADVPASLSLPGSLNGRSSLTGGGAAGSVGAARGAALSQSTGAGPAPAGHVRVWRNWQTHRTVYATHE